MRVLLVHNTYQERGGEDIVFQQERDLLIRHGHQVSVYLRSNDEIKSEPLSRRAKVAKDTIWAGDSKREVLKLIREQRPDVVHAHNTFTRISPSIYEACQETGVPIVQTLHNFRLLCPNANFFRAGHVCQECALEGVWRSLLYGCYRQSRAATAAVALMLSVHRHRKTWQEKVDGYIALSEFARREFVRGGLPYTKLHVKPNFVYPDPAPEPEVGEYALFIGRLSPEKGVYALSRAWGHLSKGVPLRIVGSGPLRAEIETQIAAKDLPNVHCCGQLSPDETKSALRGARFLVVPSECFENFPMVIAEAFACGKPVICSRLGSMQEIVADGRTGLHFSPGDDEDLADKVNWAWVHRDDMHAMGEAARREYESRYTAEKNYETLISIYRKVQAIQ